MNNLINRVPVTVIIAVKNEEANIGKCLTALRPAEKILLLDSESEDNTVPIAKGFDVEVIQFKYNGGYPKKRQWALDNLKIYTEWIFFVDADEVVPDKLWREIEIALQSKNIKNINAFIIRKGFHFLGKKFRYGGFSHKAVLLFRNGFAKFEHLINDPSSFQDMEVHERLIVEGNTSNLKTSLIHEDFKDLSAYIDRHNKYSTWEAAVRYNFIEKGEYGKLTIKPRLFGNAQEKRRFFKKIAVVVPLEPFFWFIYHYLFRLGFLEGRRGLIACQIRSSYIAQVRAKIFERRLKQGKRVRNIGS